MPSSGASDTTRMGYLAMRAATVLGMVLLGLALAPAAHADAFGSWSPLPAMTTPRYGAVAAAMTDGRVLVAGGVDGSGSATASAEIYDPTAETWTPVASMGSARAFAAAAPLSGDRVLVAGGEVDGSPSASTEIYDATTDTWSPAPPMEYAREGAAAAPQVSGKVWVIGGSDLGISEIYDPVADAWSPALFSTPADAAAGAVAVSDGGALFVAGGYELGSSTLDPWWGLNAAVDSWVGDMPEPLYEASAAPLLDGDVLLVGGSASETDPVGTNGAALFDDNFVSVATAWSSVASMSTPRYGAVAAPLPDGDVLVAGGEGDSGALASAEEFSPPTISVPVNIIPPSVGEVAVGLSGPLSVGDTLTAKPGTWDDTGAPGATVSVQWQRCLSWCEDVSSNLPDQNYELTSADVGATIHAVVTMDYDGLSAWAVSNPVGPVSGSAFHLVPGTLQAWLPYLSEGTLTDLQLPVVRDDDANDLAEVSYRVWDPTGTGYPALAPVTGTVTFMPGQLTATIDVPLTADGVPPMPGAIEVELYDPVPAGVVAPSEETLDIRDPSSYVRDPANPLALPTPPPAGNPLAGAQFFADYYQSLPARQASAWAARYPAAAAKISIIAREPNTERFGAWNGPNPGPAVAAYLDRAAREEPGTVPLLSTYRLVDGHCGHYSDPPAEQLAYHDFITGLAEGVGNHSAVLFLEMDSLITTGCLSKQGVAVRMSELRDAINVLANDPHLVVYLDAGAADALPARVAARLLLGAGVAQIQGFFLNSTHFDWTLKEIAYGEKISRLTGGKHFVINTAENGQGPLRPRDPAKEGNEVLCDPPGRGLGPLPTANTGYRNVDAFAWIANPGVSGGACTPGAPPSGTFSPVLALELVKHEDFKVR